MPDVHYVPDKIRMVKQSSSNHQGSSSEPLRVDVAEDFMNGIRREQEASYSRYETMLEYGLVREVARVNTPVSRYSKMRVKGNLRNWLHFLNLRLRDNAQYEIQVFAEAVASIIQEKWPRTYALFLEYDLHGVRLSKTEAEAWKRSKE
jgi:thymidylate synthase (FAD)